jgi:peptidoglycan/LPS O-acetylase OafA/YrhL
MAILQRNEDFRYRHLDGLRGVASAIVVIFHTILCFDRAIVSGAPIEAHFGWEINFAGAPFVFFTRGGLPVMIFFVLSGYVISKFLIRVDVSLLFLVLRRYIRLGLPILVTTIFSYILFLIAFEPNLAQLTKSTWLTTIYQQEASLPAALSEGTYGALLGLVPQPLSYNPSLWTMALEFTGSLLLFAIFRATRFVGGGPSNRLNLRTYIFLLLAIAFSFSYLGLFACGAFLACNPRAKPIGSLTASGLLALGILFGSVPWSAYPWWGIDFAIPMFALPYVLPFPIKNIFDIYSAIGAIIIFVTVLNYGPAQRFLSARPFTFLGELSFPLYLIHVPLLISSTAKSALALHEWGMPYSVVMVATMVVQIGTSLTAAWILLLICERPAISLSRVFTKSEITSASS